MTADGAGAVQIRTARDDAEEKWWFSALDMVAALTDQTDYTKARIDWKWLKGKLKRKAVKWLAQLTS